MTYYVTDRMAKNGIIDLNTIEVNGKNKSPYDDTNIGVLVNAPRSHVIAKAIITRNTWKGFEFRSARSLNVGRVISKNFGNDGGHICMSNVHIQNYQAFTKIKKEYSNKNHPDILQIFAYVAGRIMRNIRINRITSDIRGCDKHGGIHLTENNIYDRIFIGEDGISIYLDAELYPYWFSATNLSNSIIGHRELRVSGKEVRVKDVKHSGIISKNIHFVGMEKKKVILDPWVNGDFYNTFPKDELEKLLRQSFNNKDHVKRIMRKEDETMLRLADAKMRRLGI